ncbi:hypothetical protein, partial [Pontimicrobium sp. MEBiC06410]
FNCQKEDDTLQVQQTALKSNVNISRLNTKAIENDKNLMRIINKAETKRIESKANKTVYNAQYDFTINTNYAKVITNSNGLKNYTFGVYRTENNGVLENLLLQEQEDHSFKVSLVQYNITPNERNALASREIVDVEDKITYITLEDISDTIFDKVNSDAETCTVYSYEWEAGNLCDSGQHDYADGAACDYWSNPNQAATSGGWVLTSNETSCGDGGGSTNTDSNPNSNPNGSNQTTSNGGGIEPSTTPVLCPGCPVISEEDEVCLNSLQELTNFTPEMSTWLQSQSQTLVNQIEQVLQEGGCNEESQQQAINDIYVLIANPDANPFLRADCRSFEFAKPPGALQRSCAVTNFNNTFYTAGIRPNGSPYYGDITVPIDLIYFTMPAWMTNSQAANLTALAVNNAMDAGEAYFISNPDITALQLKIHFLEVLEYQLSLIGGSFSYNAPFAIPSPAPYLKALIGVSAPYDC